MVICNNPVIKMKHINACVGVLFLKYNFMIKNIAMNSKKAMKICNPKDVICCCKSKKIIGMVWIIARLENV